MPLITGARALLAATGRALVAAGEPVAAPNAPQAAPSSGLAASLRRLLAPPPAAAVRPDFEAARLAGVHVEPQVRTFCRWTPADLHTAMIQADGGNLRMAADLCDAILGDDRAPAVMATRVNAVLGSELTFEAGAGRARKAKRAVKALEAGEDWYAAFDDTVIGYMLCWGRLLGVSLAQENWNEFPEHKGRLIPVAENWHARHLRRDTRERQWYVKVGDGGSETKAAPGDGKWIIFTPYGKNRPWATGIWRGMSRLWLLKQYALNDWGLASRKQAEGIKVGVPPLQGGDPKHGNKKVREELANDIYELAEGGAIVLPPGFDLKLVEQVANNWETFKAQIDMANAGMSILAIGSNLPTEVANAAQTGATAQTLVRLDYKKADAEALSTMAHDQSLAWWAGFNFGDRQLAPWPDWEVEPPADLQARAQLVNTVATSLKTFGEASVPIDQRAILEEFEIPQGEDVQQPLTPPADALQKIADAHNLLHERRASIEMLSTVWERGASIAPARERDRWAMGRVNAFLHLLATGAPEHPEYTADNDVLPTGPQ